MWDFEITEAVAVALAAGELHAGQAADRAAAALGRPWGSLGPLAQRYVEHFEGKVRPRRRDVFDFVWRDGNWRRFVGRYRKQLTIEQLLHGADGMRPVPAARSWPTPSIESPSELAAWLGVDMSQLEWLADLKGLTHRRFEGKLRHYRYRLMPKRSGGLRLIEAPKARLKSLQRRILDGILQAIPPHPAVHGFCRGRSIQSFAAPHVRQPMVLRVDLRDFFPSIIGPRIQALFRTLGYPECVADLLGGLCTTATPGEIWRPPGADPHDLFAARQVYSRPHVPQGAPTSPALANACAYRMDCRLAALAEAAGARYTRYADDLAFSGDGDFARRARRFSHHVGAILIEEGFQANYRKTRLMRAGARQHLAGLVTNAHLNIPRDDYDRLKAILTNCLRLGPATQNRDNHPAFREHLEGRVGFVETVNAARGRKLRSLLERIDWDPKR